MEEDLFEDENERKKSAKREKSDVFAEEETAEEPLDSDDDQHTEEIEINDAIEEVFRDHEESEAVDDVDDENWIPLDDEEDLDIPEDDADIDEHEDFEEIDLEDVLKEDEAEADIGAEEEGEDTASEDNTEEKSKKETDVDDMLEDFEDDSEDQVSEDGDDKAWIPLEEEEELEAMGDDEDIGAEEGLEEDLADAEGEPDTPIDEEEEELDLEKIIEEEGLDISDGIENDSKDAEAPPWEEEVEIPLHGTAKTPKKNKKILIAFIVFLVALTGAGLYGLYQFKMISERQKHILKGEDPSGTHVVKKKLDQVDHAAGPVKMAEEKPLAERPQVPLNAVPTISGEPLIEVGQGVPYSFFPKASDADPSDMLTFFIANQPVWTNFDTTTGALTGTPNSEDVGTYKRIAILVTDGRATASLPLFDITVTGTGPQAVIAKDKEAEPAMPAAGKKPEEKPAVKIEPTEETVVERGPYVLPDLSDLIKQKEFQDAAIEYHKNVRDVPQAYSLKLEVDCVEKSVEVAYQSCDFDPRMFILPRQINGRNCFIVFWGLYPTKNEALKALSSIPAFFKNQGVKPNLIILKQYL